MLIKTKFNVGDEVWFIYSDRVCNNTIYSISTTCNNISLPEILYKIEFAEKYVFKIEHGLFATKEELLNSL